QPASRREHRLSCARINAATEKALIVVVRHIQHFTIQSQLPPSVGEGLVCPKIEPLIRPETHGIPNRKKRIADRLKITYDRKARAVEPFPAEADARCQPVTREGVNRVSLVFRRSRIDWF